MPSISSECEDQLVVRQCPQFLRTDSIASDATAPNLPGPGRTIGKLFDAIGLRVERFLNNWASRRRLRPKDLVEDIRRSRHHTPRYYPRGYGVPNVAPTAEEYRVLERLCRKLLKRCRSHMLETQLTALEAVTTLALEDPYIRQMFAEVLHGSYLIPKFKERELYIACSRAVASIKDNEVHEFWMRNFQCGSNDHRSRGPEFVKELEDQIKYYVRDPGLSFLMGRYLRPVSLSLGTVEVYFPVCKAYFSVAMEDPSLIEWESFVKIFIFCFDYLPVRFIMRLALNFPIMHIPLEELEKIMFCPLSAIRLPCWPPKDNLKLMKRVSWFSLDLLPFLYRLCGSWDAKDQLWALRNVDRNIRTLFRGTLLDNEILIVWLHFDRARAIIHDHTIPFRTESVVMLRYYLLGNKEQQSLAKAAILQSMQACRYFKYTMSNLVCQYHDNARLNSRDNLKLTSPMIFKTAPHPEYSPACIFLHKGTERDSGPIRRAGFCENIDIVLGENSDMHKADILAHSGCKGCFENLYCWLGVDGNKQPLDVTGHFPVLAGFDISGKEIYLAAPREERKDFDEFSYVPNGARSISIADRDGQVKVFSRFGVLLLKNDPCDVGVPNIPPGAKFQTGPSFWIRDDHGYNTKARKPPDFSWNEIRPTDSWTFPKIAFEDNAYGWHQKCQYDMSEDIVEMFLKEIGLPTTAAGKGFVHALEDTNNRIGPVQGTLKGLEDGSDAEWTVGVGALGEIPHERQLALDEELRQIKAKEKALGDQMRELEARRREIEIIQAARLAPGSATK